MKIIALILARGGSKGIPKKNIKLLNDKPLLSYVINEVKKCSFFDDIVVSSEDAEIREVARDLGVKDWVRPDELATDDAKSIDAVKDFLEYHTNIDIVCLLNACCPFTSALDISGVVKLMLETGADSVVSLVEDFSAHPSKLCYLAQNGLIERLEDTFETGERQALKSLYKRNTAIYCAKCEVIESGTFFGPKTYGYIMKPENSLDINSSHDFLMAELLMKHYANK